MMHNSPSTVSNRMYDTFTKIELLQKKMDEMNQYNTFYGSKQPSFNMRKSPLRTDTVTFKF